jgi:hypothetical protein
MVHSVNRPLGVVGLEYQLALLYTYGWDYGDCPKKELEANLLVDSCHIHAKVFVEITTWTSGTLLEVPTCSSPCNSSSRLYAIWCCIGTRLHDNHAIPSHFMLKRIVT